MARLGGLRKHRLIIAQGSGDGAEDEELTGRSDAVT